LRATAPIHAALFLLAGSVLVLEVALTRVFSVMLWNHYTFLVISMALLGFGAAGSVLSARSPAGDEASVRRFLARSCAAFGVATLLCVMAVTRLDVEPTQLLRRAEGTFRLGALYVLAAVPFFFAGLAICRLLTVSAGQIATLYFADLVGAGVGALFVPFLLDAAGAPATIVLACVMGSAAGALFAGDALGPAGRWLGRALPVGLAALAVWVQAADPWTVHPPRSKPLRPVENQIELSRWSLHARIDVLESRRQAANFGSGVARPFWNRPIEYRIVYMDGSNPSRLIRWDQDRWFLERVLTAAPYALVEKPRVLVIGSGGGIDTMVGRQHGAEHVTAVEINPATVDLVRHEFGDYLGHLFEQENVALLAREGRHFLTLDDARYDLIRLTGVDTSAAAASAANSLDHAYIYTVEALRDLYRHLEPEGVLAISRAGGWEIERLVNVLRAALETEGVTDLADRVAVVSNGAAQAGWADALVRKRPYTEAEVAALSAWVAESKLQWLHHPFRGGDHPVSEWIRADAARLAQLHEQSAPNLRPVTDDDPFFFELLRFHQVVRALLDGDIGMIAHSGYVILTVTLVQAIVLSILFILVPLGLRGRTGTRIGRHAWSLAYFALLGLGFILVELVYIQKYMIVVGGPARAMSVTLFSILVFGGLGAFASRRVDLGSRHGLAVAVAGVTLVIALSIASLRFVLPWLLGLDFTGRLVFGILALAPVSFALGFPFPLGIRRLELDAPELVPWAWAGNACLTVVGSILCQIVSISAGFSAALMLALGCYALAVLCAGLAPAVAPALGARTASAGTLAR
jgi:SAM-dependent methyltransferase